MTDDSTMHFQSHRCLPCIILAHALPGSTLEQGSPQCMGMMQSLPPKAPQKLSHMVHVISPLQHLGYTHRTYPKTRPSILVQPRTGCAWTACRQFIEQVDQKRRVQQHIHRRAFTASLLSPIRLSISASTSAAKTKGLSRINLRTSPPAVVPSALARRERAAFSVSGRRMVRTLMV